MIAEKLLLSADYQSIDLIIPVPMHGKKLHKRGYNQSLLIAEGIAEVLKIPVDSTTLIKVKATNTQTNKNRSLRHDDMKNVFSIQNVDIFRDKHLLLVDDVITTGATIEACALEISKGKPGKLSIAAVAFAD